MKRVFLIVLDSVGIGELPDAADYGDKGTNTLKAAASSKHFYMPNMSKPIALLFTRNILF